VSTRRVRNKVHGTTMASVLLATLTLEDNVRPLSADSRITYRQHILDLLLAGMKTD